MDIRSILLVDSYLKKVLISFKNSETNSIIALKKIFIYT